MGPLDRIRGLPGRPLVIFYGDFECPQCAATEARLREAEAMVCFRHFPVRASHPRAWAAAAAAEAAAAQGKFWQMHDLLFEGQAYLEDPHLWARAQRLFLDVGRFDADRRSPAARERIDEEVRGGVRAGVVSTPGLFLQGRLLSEDELFAALAAA